VIEKRTFTGKDVQEVLARVKSELGEDALIHNTRWKKRNGLLGLFKGEEVEIEASSGGVDLNRLKNERQRQAGRGLVERRYRETIRNSDDRAANAEIPDRLVEEELRRLRTLIEEMHSSQDSRCAWLAAGLIRQGFPDVDARRLAETCINAATSSDTRSREKMNERLEGVLRDIIRCRSGLESGRAAPRVYALVGPTGTGKTTTVAKLAAIHALKKVQRVGIISIDNYRVGGSEQIRRYAEIIGVPLCHVASVREAETARNAMADREIVLVDTTGRSPQDQLAVSEMALMLREIRPDEVILTVESGILGERDERTKMSFGRYFSIGRVIVTKLDEIPYIGAGVALSMSLNAPLAYITNGQEVPDDIRSAGKDAIVKLISAAME